MFFKIEENKQVKNHVYSFGGRADYLIKDEEFVGACYKQDKDCFEIFYIEIKEEFRHKGYGTVFVKIYEAMAKLRQYNKIKAKCELSNEGGINFWENHVGWTREECVKGQLVFYKTL